MSRCTTYFSQRFVSRRDGFVFCTNNRHEAHPENDAQAAQGNGQALRVGDLKVVLRSGSSWSTGSHIGSNDGWFGGMLSSDRNHDGYVFPPSPALHATPTTACGRQPANVNWALQFGNESLYACESHIGLGNNASACLFNITAGAQILLLRHPPSVCVQSA